MRFRRDREEEPRLGITPLIDIVFLLLIFFMVTSHFDVTSGVKIDLPKVDQKSFNKNEDKITLVIDKEGKIFLRGEAIDRDALKTRLEQLINEKNFVNLVLHADQETRHGKVVEAMDLAKKVGVNSIIITAQWNPEKVL